jgi:hypothetical protein
MGCVGQVEIDDLFALNSTQLAIRTEHHQPHGNLLLQNETRPECRHKIRVVSTISQRETSAHRRAMREGEIPRSSE